MKHLLENAITGVADDYEVKCPECHKVFGVTEREPIAGCSDWDYIYCPYCGWKSDHETMRVEYDCYKLDEVNKA